MWKTFLPQKSKNVRPHSSNSIENATPFSGTSPLGSYRYRYRYSKNTTLYTSWTKNNVGLYMYVHKALGTKAIIRRGGRSEMFNLSLMNKLMRIEWVTDWVSEQGIECHCSAFKSKVKCLMEWLRHIQTTSYPWAKNEVMVAWKCCIFSLLFTVTNASDCKMLCYIYLIKSSLISAVNNCTAVWRSVQRKCILI